MPNRGIFDPPRPRIASATSAADTGRGRNHVTSTAISASFDLWGVPGHVITSKQTTTPGANVLIYQPFWLDSPITVTAMACEVTTGAGSNAHLGIVRCDPSTGWPLETGLAFTGTVSVSGTGVKSIPNLAVPLDRGAWATLFVADAAAVMRAFTSQYHYFASGSGNGSHMWFARFSFATAPFSNPVPRPSSLNNNNVLLHVAWMRWT